MGVSFLVTGYGNCDWEIIILWMIQEVMVCVNQHGYWELTNRIKFKSEVGEDKTPANKKSPPKQGFWHFVSERVYQTLVCYPSYSIVTVVVCDAVRRDFCSLVFGPCFKNSYAALAASLSTCYAFCITPTKPSNVS
jgi:hypothetical protein